MTTQRMVNGVLVDMTAADQTAEAARQAAAANDPASQYRTRLSAGLTITSTATPALNGTYAVDPTMQARISAVAAGLANGKGFPHGATTYAWPDIGGTRHTFGEADWLNFGAAVEAYVTDLDQQEALDFAGGTPTWPSATATIA